MDKDAVVASLFVGGNFTFFVAGGLYFGGRSIHGRVLHSRSMNRLPPLVLWTTMPFSQIARSHCRPQSDMLRLSRRHQNAAADQAERERGGLMGEKITGDQVSKGAPLPLSSPQVKLAHIEESAVMKSPLNEGAFPAPPLQVLASLGCVLALALLSGRVTAPIERGWKIIRQSAGKVLLCRGRRLLFRLPRH